MPTYRSGKKHRIMLYKSGMLCRMFTELRPLSIYSGPREDGQGAGARGISTKMSKVTTTAAKKWWQRSEYVFHLHFHVEGAAVGSNRVLMFEGQTEIFLF